MVPEALPSGADDGTPVPSAVAAWVGSLQVRFVKLHILCQADHEPIYGSGVVSTLTERGYRVPTGTVYAVLLALEAADLLEGRDRVVRGRRRKYYRATRLGRRVLARAREHVVALHEELDQG